MLTVGMDDYLDNGLEPTDWVGGRYWVLVFAQKIARRGRRLPTIYIISSAKQEHYWSFTCTTERRIETTGSH
jgi:hypothetical protein